jgi:hypothetical protein
MEVTYIVQLTALGNDIATFTSETDRGVLHNAVLRMPYDDWVSAGRPRDDPVSVRSAFVRSAESDDGLHTDR